MLRRRLSVAVYGMLHYYGVMSMTELFVLSRRCGLCTFPDYAFFCQRIQAELIDQQHVYVYKDCLCHKWVRNPAVIEEVQREKVATGYRKFSLQAYLTAGKRGMVWSEPFCRLQDFLKENTHMTAAEMEHALVNLWRELNNMSELVTLTAQCVQYLQLPWQPEEKSYMRVLEELRNVALQMPQWHCKGYSPEELEAMEAELC